MKSFLALIGFGWTKWKTVESNKRMIRQDINPIIGYKSDQYIVFVDVQKRTNSISGKTQYKNIER